ncbi:MAG: tRNA dihydrouridine synthase DusB [Bdellovibrionaceae bacterium]|nr:tRNA dihydrouridine synthase DusB [Pseudobdellovibrionaceae bacterium]MBX3034112.1 tRNA dihydrouridine synthase DusB [Pseudobdellovibrionaceae bacterium]
MDPLKTLRDNPFVLAPMAGITDHAFRSFMKKLGSSVVVTELISATGIQYQSQKTIDLMSFGEDQRPVGIQLFGEEPEVVAQAARFAQEKGADFVDLNFGCPVPKVVKKGGGSAILRDPQAVRAMVSTVKKAIDIPLTIKIRTGWDAGSRNAVEICHIAYEEGLTWVAIHGRTRSQAYEGKADWDYIAEVKAQSKIPILGNGDVLTPHQAIERLRQTGVDGVMIGRGALKNPYIFVDALKIWRGESLSGDNRDFAALFRELAECIQARCSEHITQIQLRKFAAWFATGYPGAAAFRKAIFQSTSVSETMETSIAFFEALRLAPQEDTSDERFLMGGHG